MDVAQSILSGVKSTDRVSEEIKPRTLGSGFVTSVLGEGGAAIVYEIWNPKLEIHRAVKLWRPNLSDKDLQRFETEIKITSKLDHPNIVEIHTVGEWNGRPYIEMERIDGVSLQQLLKANTLLPPVVAVAVMMFICRALMYAHEEEFNLYGRRRKGVIHCDIKPANIMITRTGLVKLMDFGIANPTNVSLHTDPDKVTGSLQYMAPEQIRSRQVDARTDIYSIGVVLYEMVSGMRAFPSRQLLEVIEKRKTNDYIPLRQFDVRLPRRIYRLVETCMALEPQDRYHDISELHRQLEGIYRWLTYEEPQDVIRRYVETAEAPVRNLRVARRLLVPAVAAGVPTILLLTTVLFLVPGPHRTGRTQPAIASKSAVETQSAVLPQPQPPTDTPQKTLSSTPGPSLPKPLPAAPSSRAPTPDRAVGKASPATPQDRLSMLLSLVESGKLDVALRRFEARTIEDGAYYSYYARCLYESGEWRRAYEMAEKSLGVPSKLVTKNDRIGQSLLYRAKYLSVLYDSAPSQQSAQAAITAWWNVRNHFDGTSQSAKASFAESEIGRISTFLAR